MDIIRTAQCTVHNDIDTCRIQYVVRLSMGCFFFQFQHRFTTLILLVLTLAIRFFFKRLAQLHVYIIYTKNFEILFLYLFNKPSTKLYYATLLGQLSHGIPP